jgi:hypothetical protein
MIKEKKCKGSGPAIGYGCGKMVKVENRKYGLGKMCCFTEWLMESENGKIHMQKAMIIGKSRVEKQVKKTHIVQKKKEKEKLTNWNERLQSKINEIARLIDKGLPCLARGHHANQLHGGHIFARGGNQTIRFNLHNIHRQSAQSNHFGNDDGLLREGLINEYGNLYFEFISGLRKMPLLKLSNIELHDFYKKACKICNRLKKENLTYSLSDRIQLRNDINFELMIYETEHCIFELTEPLL